MSAPTGRYHLPAIIERDNGATYWTLASACGKRGAIAARDASLQSDLFSAETHCPDCLVKWDAAEEAGGLRVVWVLNGPTWAGPGGVVHGWDWLKEVAGAGALSPGGLQRWAAGLAERMSTMAVIVRDGTPKVKRLQPRETT